MTEASSLDPRPITALELSRLLAHECRTPLHAISGFAEVVLSGGAGPLSEDAVECLRQIAHAGRALADALQLAQEVSELRGPSPGPGAPAIDLEALLEGLGFARTGERTQRPLPLIRGDQPAWRRIGRLCRGYIQGSDAASVVAWTGHMSDDGLELELKRADLSNVDNGGVLAIEAARLGASYQGAGLRLVDRTAILVAWPKCCLVGSSPAMVVAHR